MTFVLSAFQLTIFFTAFALIFFYLANIIKKPNKRMVEGKEIIFLIAIAYLVLAHFSMFISLGQALDENYTAPCENLVNQSEAINATTTQYTYYDSCAATAVPAGSSALVVIFTWLLFVGIFGIFLALIVWTAKLALRFI